MQTNGNNWSHGKIILVSAAVGLIALLLLLLWLGFAFWSSFIWGLVVGVIVYIILTLNFAGEADGHSDIGASSASGHGSDVGVTTGAGATGAASASAGSASAAGDEMEATADAVAASSEDAMAADAGAGDASAATTSDASDAAGSGSAVKPTAELAGEAELAERKGDWKYDGSENDGSGADGAGDVGSDGDGGADTGSDAGSDTSAASETAAEKAAADAALGEDYDKDGVREGTDEGTKPSMLSEARDGGADNLKEIKGVGPAMEKLLNSLGVFHFDQVAAWSADEVAWVDANLKGFKGRVSRDNWVDQAKILMTGAETEFSQRVEDGKVY